MARAGEAVAEWRRLVDHDRYGPMTADDASFTRLTGLVKLRYAARRLGVTPNDVRGRIETGTIRGRKLGSIWYVSESAAPVAVHLVDAGSAISGAAARVTRLGCSGAEDPQATSTATERSIGTPTRLPHSVHDPS
jgi:hypothetical protein